MACTTSATRQTVDKLDAHLLHTIGVAPAQASSPDLMHALAHSARDELARRWVESEAVDQRDKVRRVYYLSMEFLIGRSLGNALQALALTGPAAEAALAHARTLEDLQAIEPDAALGNGGLGRLAACFLDAMASRGLPSSGYGIRYEFGMFAQDIQGGRQVEHPDPWLADGTPWEFPRQGIHYPVRFGGWVERGTSPESEMSQRAPSPRRPSRLHLRQQVRSRSTWAASAHRPRVQPVRVSNLTAARCHAPLVRRSPDSTLSGPKRRARRNLCRQPCRRF